MRTRPEVVAHRGASAVEAEHTLAAYQRALADGADGLECDVRLTRDGVLVCLHDRRVNRTSSGRGVVSTLELAELQELDFGSWHAAGDPSEVLTLESLLDAVTALQRPVRLAIETKHPTRYSGQVEEALVELLARYGLAQPNPAAGVRVQVMSFAPSALRRVRLSAPDLPTVQLMRRVPLYYRDGRVSPSATIAGPSVAGLRAFPAYVERAHALGHEVHVWTVDEVSDVDAMVALGVDVIITNKPDLVLAHLTP